MFFITLIGRCYAYVSLADVFAWQMLYAIWDVADVMPLWKMFSSLFCEWQMLLPYDVVEDVVPLHYTEIFHSNIVTSDVKVVINRGR